jgi:collagen type III alpha
MAVDVETRKPPKQELFIQSNLDDLRRRLHRLDIASALLGLAIVVFGYALLAGLFDFAVGGSDAWWVGFVRGAGFLVFLGLAGWFSYALVQRWLRPLNPYFVAREIERQIPDAKNSVINWLDLKDEKLPPAIRTAVTSRAAKDVQETDPDKAVDGRTNWHRASVVGILLVGLMILLAMSPRQFGSLMARAFLPFRGSALDSRTAITMVRPQSGNAEAAPNSRFEIAAQIEGRHPAVNQPGAPMLHWRYHQKDSFLTMPLQEEAERTWTASLLPDQVKSGFWYKITAGDASTAEFRVGVRSQPLVREFDVRYVYRPYLRRDDERIKFPNETAVWPRILGPRGTDIVLTVRANVPVREARLEITTDGKKKILPIETPADDPATMIARFKLDKSGSFRVLFQSEDGQPNLDRDAYQIEAIEDLPPSVTLSKPGEDVKLAANGTLPLEGHARDDWGIQSLSLQVRVVQGAPQQELLAKPYRGGRSFKFANGSYPDFIEYADFLALDALRNAKGEKFETKPGMVLEYWLEARDNSDWPSAAGTVGKSNAYKILIEEAAKDEKKRQEERQQAEQQAKDQQQKQDQNLKKEEQRRKDEEQQKNQGGGNSDDQKRKEDLEKKLQEQAEKLKKDLEGQNEPKNAKNDPKEPDNNPMGKGNASGSKDGKSDSKDPMASNNPKQDPNGGKEDSKQPMTKEGKEKSNDPMASNDPNGGKKEPSGKDSKDGKSDSKDPMASAKEKEPNGNSKDPMTKSGQENPKDNPMASNDPKKDPSSKEPTKQGNDSKDPMNAKEPKSKDGNPMASNDPNGGKKDPMTAAGKDGKDDPKKDPTASNNPNGQEKKGPEQVGAKENPKEGKDGPMAKKEGPNPNTQPKGKEKEDPKVGNQQP